jgi:Putative DNA-binding domain
MRAARPDTSSTRRLQRAFLRELAGVADRGVRFRQPPRGTVEDRWHVYAHGYAARLTDALSLEYAAASRILGPEAFAALVSRYVAVFPPRSFDLARAGDRLARFLEFDSLTLDLPFLPDLARLEAAAAACFTAADAEPVRWNALGELGPEEVARLSFRLAPGVAFIESAWPLADLWNVRLEVDEDAVSIPVEGRPQSVLVWRRGERVRVEAVSPDESSLVAAAGVGVLTLEDLLALSGTPAELADLSAVLGAFRALVERGVFLQERSVGWTGALAVSKEVS